MTKSNDKKCCSKKISKMTQSDETKWFYKVLTKKWWHKVMTNNNDTNWLNKVITQIECEKWWNKVILQSDEKINDKEWW